MGDFFFLKKNISALKLKVAIFVFGEARKRKRNKTRHDIPSL